MLIAVTHIVHFFCATKLLVILVTNDANQRSTTVQNGNSRSV
jgi:hypothetical protein